MKLSRIIKSAYRRAVKAGFKGSLKQWADNQNDGHTDQWFANKSEQRKASTRVGFNNVHAQQHARSMQHCAGKGTPVYVREGGRP